MTAPIIVSIDWGNVCIKQNFVQLHFKDVVILPNDAYNWNFKEGFDKQIDLNYTSHQHKTDMSKGIQIHSVRNLLDQGNVFILTTGFHDSLGVNKSTIKFLEHHGKKVIVVNSKDVIDIYNKCVINGHKVVALVHSTC